LDIKEAQNLDDFDTTNILDVRELFKYKKFISLKPEVLSKIDN
jgi:hypothetical protein